ncbi:MAG: hypothetical protein ACK4FR_14390 [Tabrizicola sp.]
MAASVLIASRSPARETPNRAINSPSPGRLDSTLISPGTMARPTSLMTRQWQFRAVCRLLGQGAGRPAGVQHRDSRAGHFRGQLDRSPRLAGDHRGEDVRRGVDRHDKDRVATPGNETADRPDLVFVPSLRIGEPSVRCPDRPAPA